MGLESLSTLTITIATATTLFISNAMDAKKTKGNEDAPKVLEIQKKLRSKGHSDLKM